MTERRRPGHSLHSRLLGAPKKIIKRRRSTGCLRSNFKDAFLKRLKTCRSKSVDRFRHLVENYGDTIDYQSVPTLRHMLQGDPEATTLMQNEEVNEILQRMEVELADVDLNDDDDGDADVDGGANGHDDVGQEDPPVPPAVADDGDMGNNPIQE